MRALLLVIGCVGFVGCTFGAKTCDAEGGCELGATCMQGFCVAAGGDSGTGGGSTGGGGGATGGGGAGGGSQDYCDAGLRCAEWQECAADGTGGACADSEYDLLWATPDSGMRTRATSLVGQIVLTKRDGGLPLVATVPVYAAVPGSTAVVSGAQSPFTVSIGLGANDGNQSFVAGWRDGGPLAQLDVEVDRTGPTFVITVPTDAGYGAPAADFLPADPTSPASFRKDEVISVRVTTLSNDVATVKLVARFGAEQSHEVTTSSSCTSGSGRCDDFLLDLSRVSMSSFSGLVQLTAEGADDLGTGSGVQTPVSVPVTRWQWARRVGGVGIGSLRSTPAVGSGGRVFLGISNGSANGVVAINPNGTIAWGPVPDGPVEGTVAVGRSAPGEWLFYNLNSGAAKSVGTASGTPTQSCSAGGSAASSIGGVAVFAENTASVGSISLQPGTVGNRARQHEAQTDGCYPSLVDSLVGIQSPGNMVIGANSAYYANSDGNLRRLGVAAGSAPIPGTLNQSVGGVGIVNGLAMLSGTRVAGGGGGPGIGRLFAFDVTASVTDSSVNAWPAATTLSSPTSGPSVGGGGVFAQYRVSGRSNLIRVNPSTGVVVAQSGALGGSGPVQSSFTSNGAPTPTLGNGNLAYVVDEKGSLFVVRQDFLSSADAQWSVALPASVTTSGVVVTASPNLDCNRRAPMSQTGVLYIATETGWLVSYLVDSRGLDPAAPWPKYARDSRNTGNFDGPPIACP